MSSSSITAQMTPPVGGDQNRGPQLMAMFWTETPVSMLLLSLRSYARVSIRGVGYDDWIMLATAGVILLAEMTRILQVKKQQQCLMITVLSRYCSL